MDLISKWCRSKRSMENHTVVVTGCNTGIGRETVFDMYKRGARVIMACRDIHKAEEARQYIISRDEQNGKGSLVIEQLDLGSMQSVRECATRILKREENINILINNAAVLMALKDKTEDGFETHIGINHFGHALFTLLLLPKIVKNASAKIIFVSSSVHNVYHVNLDDINMNKCKYNNIAAYGRSKCANVMFAKALHLQLREHKFDNVNTYSVHPGLVYTDIARHTNKSIVPGAVFGYKYILRWFLKSAACGAQTTVYCAVDEECDYQSGLYYSNCAVASSSKHCTDDETAIKLWDLTLELLDLKNYDLFAAEAVKN